MPTREEMAQAFARKDASYDGVFYVAVKTTGIFCRPSCPSRPNAENVEFFLSVKECLFAGYRPCKRCHPLEANGKPPEWAQELISRVEAAPDARLKAADLRALGITPERARRWFQQHYGMSFAAWCRGNRLAGAFMRIRQGATLDDAIFDSGFQSHSGFREAFTRVFGEAPGRSRENGDRVVVTMLETPLGPLLAGATDQGINFLEYTDRRMLEHNLKAHAPTVWLRDCAGPASPAGAVARGIERILSRRAAGVHVASGCAGHAVPGQGLAGIAPHPVWPDHLV